MGKTITTHFLEGTPKGIQSIQVSNKTIMAYIIPRAELKKCNDLSELKSPSLYILFGENIESNNKAYIGETDNFLDRVIDHNRKKDFWDKALVFTSMASTLNKADIMYLEYLSLTLAKEIDNYNLSENVQRPKKPTLLRHAIDTMDDFFEDIKFITEFVGYSIFRTVQQESNELFFTKSRKSNAKGFYDENGFTVLKGSSVALGVVKSFGWKEKRERFIKEFTELIDNKLILKVDYTFKSPSTAADFCIGSSNNGWIVWKNYEGKTLDEIYRN